MSPLEEAWRQFQRESPAVPHSWDDWRPAFEAGLRAGIKYACSQIEWDIQNRVTEHPTGELK